MKPQLPRDSGNDTVQAVCPVSTTTLNSSGSSQRVTLPVTTDIVRIASTVDLYVEFGGASVNATSSSMLFPAGAEVFSTIDLSITHIAILNVGATPGVVSISKMV